MSWPSVHLFLLHICFNWKLQQKTISALPDYTMSNSQQFSIWAHHSNSINIRKIFYRDARFSTLVRPGHARIICHVLILDFRYEITCIAILAKPFGVFPVTNHHLYFFRQTIHQSSQLWDNYNLCQHLARCFSTVSLCARLNQHDNQRGGGERKLVKRGRGGHGGN